MNLVDSLGFSLMTAIRRCRRLLIHGVTLYGPCSVVLLLLLQVHVQMGDQVAVVDTYDRENFYAAGPVHLTIVDW